jgi:hypothetical protein
MNWTKKKSKSLLNLKELRISSEITKIDEISLSSSNSSNNSLNKIECPAQQNVNIIVLMPTKEIVNIHNDKDSGCTSTKPSKARYSNSLI